MHWVSSNDSEGVGVPCEGATYIRAVVGNYAIIKLKYEACQGVPIMSEAWMCPAATANLFDNCSSFILD